MKFVRSTNKTGKNKKKSKFKKISLTFFKATTYKVDTICSTLTAYYDVIMVRNWLIIRLFCQYQTAKSLYENNTCIL